MNWKAKKRRPHDWYKTPHMVFAWYPVRIHTSDEIDMDEIVWCAYVMRTGKYRHDNYAGTLIWTYDFVETREEVS